MLLLGIDIGTSSIKVSVVDAEKQKCIASTQYPETETGIISAVPGWAEQSPDDWWENVQQAILKLNAQKKYNPADIAAIGITYQMHGLVLVDKEQRSLRNSIIWCDSRAVEIGDNAFEEIGGDKCLEHLLNSPGNFTASKLAWVKQNEPGVYEKADKIMLPGDFIAMKLTGNITTTIPALSEGIFWDFKENELSQDIFEYYDLDVALVPDIKNVFSVHGELTSPVAASLSLRTGIPVSYKSGDQPNNALSLNVLEPGDVAATAGTSGVIYGVTDRLTFDIQSRANTFAHVNHSASLPRLGVLLCINGTGILNRWIKDITGNNHDYAQMNELAASVAPGSEGIMIFPFGNGAERMLNNRVLGAEIRGLDLNTHNTSHLYRATQEGIAFAFRYGLDVIRETKMYPLIIKAGRANMFLSDTFTDIFVNTLKIPVELYDTDGSVGAAIGAGLGIGIFASPKEAFVNLKPVKLVEPEDDNDFEELYEKWFIKLDQLL